MAISQEQKVDFLLKKIGFTAAKTGNATDATGLNGTLTPKAGFAEAIPSPLVVANSSLWNEADSIPATPPGSDTTQVKVYTPAGALRMTVDSTVANNRAFIAYTTYNNTSSARLTNWIDTQFGPDYIIQVFYDDATDSNKKLNAGGSGNNDGWFFDYSAGVLNFNDTNVPTPVTSTNVYIVGYRYIGQTGAPSSGISTFSFLDLTVERNLDVGKQGGISTFRNNIDLNADLDVDGHTNLDNVSIAGVTTTSGHIYIAADNKKLIVGQHSDIQIFNDGSNSRIENGSGQLIIKSPTFTVQSSGTNQIISRDLAEVDLYYNGVKKFSTASSGINVVGTTTTGQLAVTGVSTFTGNIDANGDLDVDGHTNLDNVSVAGVTTFNANVKFDGANAGRDITFERSQNSLVFADDALAKFGNSEDFKLFHDGSNSYIRETGTGSLVLQSNETKIVNGANNETIAKFIEDGSVELYHNNVKRLETTNAGVSITGNNVVSGNVSAVDGTFSGNVSIGGTLTYEDVVNVDAVGLITARSGIRVTGGVIEALAGENKIPSLYSAMNNLPSAGSYHGMFAHVHATGRGYFAHAGNWLELVNKEINGVVGTGTERYNIGPVDLTTLDVSGISTFAGNVDINADIDVDGHTNLDNVSISGVTTITQDLDVDGHTNLDNVSIVGVTTFNLTNHPEPLKIISNNVNSGISTYLFTANAGLHDIRFEHNGGGNWNTRDHMRLIWSAPNEATAYPTGELFSIQPKAGVPGFTHVEFKLNDSSSGLVDSYSFGYEYHQWKIRNSTVLNLNQQGIGVTNRIYHYGYNNDFIQFGHHHMSFHIGSATDRRVLIQSNQVQFTNLSNGVDINADLDVDGHTNLDNVSVAGVTTFAENVFAQKKLSFGDSDASTTNLATFGAGDDMKIYHSGVNNHINVTGSGALIPQASTIRVLTNNYSIKNTASSKTLFQAINDNQVELYFNGVKRLETTAQGIEVTGHSELDNVNIVGVTTAAGHVLPATDSTYDLGSSSKQWRNFYVSNIVSAPGFGIIGPDLTVRNFTATGISTHVGIATFNNATFHDDVTFTTASGNNIVFDKSDNQLEFGNDVKAEFGASGQLEVNFESNSGNSVIKHTANAGYLVLHSDNLDLRPKSNTGHVYLRANYNDGVDLYFANSKKFETTNTGINVTGLTDTDTFLSSGNATFSGTITAGGATGTNGQYLKTTGSGVEWATFPTLRTRQTFTASAGQTSFTFNYTVNFIDVFVNGIKLTDAEFTATNGTSVVLAVGCFVGDIVELVSYNTVSGGGGGGGGSLNNIVEDTTPQLGGNLDLFNKTITGTGNINMTGVATATKFVGDGSGLTNVIGSGSGVVVKNSGSNVGTAGTIDFGSNLSVSSISAGIVTITGSIGITTNSGVVSIANDLDVDGHTNLDNVSIAGVTTFAQPFRCTSSSTSVFTGGIDFSQANVTSGNITFVDNRGVLFGSGNPFQIYHNSGTSIIEHNGTGSLNIMSKSGEYAMRAYRDGAVELYHDNTKRFETTSQGINVIGHSELDNVNIAGVVTAQTYKGALEATSASFSSNIDANGDLDVDGHTNLDNVSIAGFTTITQDLDVDGHTNLDNVSIAGVTTFASNVNLGDNDKIRLGDGNDLELFHDGTTSYLSNSTGQLRLGQGGTNVELYYGGVKCFHTHGDNGGSVGLFRNLTAADNTQIMLGASADYRFFHEGSSSKNVITCSTAGLEVRKNNTTEVSAKFIADGAVELYYDNVKKIETSAKGIQVGTGVTVESNGQATYTGIVTALKFVGDGSGLTNLPGGGSYGNNDVDTHLNVSGASSGQILSWNGSDYAWVADQTGGGGSGISTISGVVNIANDLDVDGHTNLDNVSISGVTTVAGNCSFAGGNVTMTASGSPNSLNVSGTSRFEIASMENALLDGEIAHTGDTNTLIKFPSNDNISFDTGGTTRLNINNSGATVTGTLAATAITGDGSGLTGVSPAIGITTNLSGSFTASAGSPSTINTFGYGSGDIVVEYTVFIKNGSDFQTQKLLAMRDGTTIHSTQFAVMFSSSLLVQLDATISGSNILLRATPETGVSGSTTYKIKREVM